MSRQGFHQCLRRRAKGREQYITYLPSIYNIPAIIFTWYKPAGQDLLPWWAEHSPDLESPQHCSQRNPRQGSKSSLAYRPVPMPVCSLKGWYLEQRDPLIIPSLTVVRRDELLNLSRGFFFILQKSLTAIPIVCKMIGYFFQLFFSLLTLFLRSFSQSLFFFRQSQFMLYLSHCYSETLEDWKLVGL